jgi:hypothetical protein
MSRHRRCERDRRQLAMKMAACLQPRSNIGARCISPRRTNRPLVRRHTNRTTRTANRLDELSFGSNRGSVRDRCSVVLTPRPTHSLPELRLPSQAGAARGGHPVWRPRDYRRLIGPVGGSARWQKGRPLLGGPSPFWLVLQTGAYGSRSSSSNPNPPVSSPPLTRSTRSSCL